MSGFTPTTEQLEAISLFNTGESLAIEAGAGTGKTATLVLLAQAAPAKRIQYVAFNKAIVTDATEKMPSNVKCNTAHAVAFRTTGKRFATRLNSPRMKSHEVAARLGIDPLVIQVPAETEGQTRGRSISRGFLGSLTMRTITGYCQTADRDISIRHMPRIPGVDDLDGNREIVWNAISLAAARAWADLTSPTGSLPYKHDHYLKLAQLEGVRIAADVILFDEAQDANPVLVDIIRQQEQRGAQVVWVGDSNQAIYEFTGAVNALRTVGADNTSYLSQSFRFGPAIAEVANTFLGQLGAPLRLIGFDKIQSVVEPIAQPDAILCRTNARAVVAVIDALAQGLRPHLVGGASDILDFARAAQRLQNGEPAAHPELACFETWDEVLQFVDSDPQGDELRLLVRLVTDFGADRILAALDSMTSEANADVIVSTAHKSKGRQWGSVQIADDFADDPLKLTDSERRLLYVAVTRAQRELDITGIAHLILPVAASSPEDAAPAADEAPKGIRGRDAWLLRWLRNNVG